MPKPETKPQIDKFREAARALETDQSEETFNRVLKKVAKSPPPKDDKPKNSDHGG
ncbi:DNA-binding protein [Mesorhizobium sp.]|uniref:DNA-binding protein n=1 Tax=Mesorhizobium sp. TaxID=1871066 RepID=UPI0025C2AC03|nr:DNA-binding protein [Mesorhizobium sp.]